MQEMESLCSTVSTSMGGNQSATKSLYVFIILLLWRYELVMRSPITVDILYCYRGTSFFSLKVAVKNAPTLKESKNAHSWK